MYIAFGEFLTFLIIAVVVAAIIHYGFGYYSVSGFGSYLSKLVIAYVGAWVAEPVVGTWLSGISYGDAYIIPSIISAIGLTVVAVDIAQTFGNR